MFMNSRSQNKEESIVLSTSPRTSSPRFSDFQPLRQFSPRIAAPVPKKCRANHIRKTSRSNEMEQELASILKNHHHGSSPIPSHCLSDELFGLRNSNGIIENSVFKEPDFFQSKRSLSRHEHKKKNHTNTQEKRRKRRKVFRTFCEYPFLLLYNPSPFVFFLLTAPSLFLVYKFLQTCISLNL